MKNNEFKITKTNDATVYTLESASSGGTSSGSVASISSPMGGVRKRGDNLISQEAQEKESPKPRNFVAKNAKMGGAGQHKDKKKEQKQGVAKHKKPYMEEMDDLKSQFLSMLKDKGIQHRVHGSPDQEKQRTKDMIAQKGSPSKPSAPSTSSAYRDGFQDGLRGHRNPRASNIHGPMSNDYDSGYHAGVMKKENGTTDEADFNTNREGMAEGDGDEAYVACIVQHNRSGRAMVHRTKPISHERAEEVIRNALAKNTFVHPPFMTIYPASAGKLDGSTIMAQFPDMSQKGLAEADGDEAYVACIVQHNRSGRAMVHRTKPISHERAEEVIRNALAKNTFVHPPFMTIYPASAGKLDGSTIMAQFPDMSQKGLAEGKADYNFDIEDLKRLERIRDLPTLKTQAMALISKPSVKPMKPEKVEWFKNALDNQRMNSPMKVIKLMYDLLLSGEGNAVVGTRSSMNPNSYRQRFGEQGVEEGSEEINPEEEKLKVLQGTINNANIDSVNRKLAQIMLKQLGTTATQVDEMNRRGFLKGVGAVAGAAALGGVSKDANAQSSSCKATLTAFNGIHNGMSYYDVVRIIGCNGSVLSDSEMAGFKTTMYGWSGKGGFLQPGANMNLMVQNGKVVMKAQFGLKESVNQGVEEGWGMGGYATAIGSEIQPGKGHEMGENDEYDGEGSMIKNDLHTIVRVSTHLAKALTDDENLPTWVIEKIAQTKGMIVSVMDYMISQHEMGQVYQKENHPDEKEDKALIRKMVKQRALKQETNDPYMAELHAQLAEKIPKNAPVKTYIDDFAKASKTPNAKGHHQFKNKSPEKVRQMAIAASYGAKNPSKKKK